jgi:hypothetical protein
VIPQALLRVHFDDQWKFAEEFSDCYSETISDVIRYLILRLLYFTISEQPMTMSMMTRLMTNENDDRPAVDDAVTIEEHNARQKQEIENDVAPCNGSKSRKRRNEASSKDASRTHKRAVEGIVRRSRKRRRRGSAARDDDS